MVMRTGSVSSFSPEHFEHFSVLFLIMGNYTSEVTVYIVFEYQYCLK